MIEIDGSTGEGGGQIIRTALALSTLTQKPFTAVNIRANRPTPGLKAQHLHGIKAFEELCRARTEGAELGSSSFTFFPLALEPKNITIDVGTAGSIGLLLQTLLLPCVFTPKPFTLALKGGTDTKWAPPIDYVSNVVIPQLRRFADIDLKLIKRGYYPKGGGEVVLSIKSKFPHTFTPDTQTLIDRLHKDASPFALDEQGHLIHIKGISHASSDLQSSDVAVRQAQAAKQLLQNTFSCPVTIDHHYETTLSTGSGITLWAIYSKNKDDIDLLNPIRIGADTLGDKTISAEEVGTKAARLLIKRMNDKRPCDPILADHLVPFLSLVGGTIKTGELTSHCKTNSEITKLFLGEAVDNDVVAETHS